MFIVQYTTKPDGKDAKIIVKNKGKNANIFAWIGSAGAGLSFCWTHIEAPINIGQIPIIKKLGGSQGIKPNKLKIEVGSLSDKSLIQPKKGWCLISRDMNSIL